ncbi:jg1100 [Pararge aegeria aegeria]|uniref:Jg1100 protein n=1 Tax=Pararge aegeria aegeria TaxID=348720 RepID=A0A8S4QGR3_9NEOP|nr:jg1100 [Pararge aegeria aegeria]
MDEEARKSTYLINPKEEIVEELEVTLERVFNDEYILPKDELSDISLHNELNNTSVSIKKATMSTREIALQSGDLAHLKKASTESRCLKIAQCHFKKQFDTHSNVLLIYLRTVSLVSRVL